MASFGNLIGAFVPAVGGALKGKNVREARDYERQQAEQARQDRLQREALQMYLLQNQQDTAQRNVEADDARADWQLGANLRAQKEAAGAAEAERIRASVMGRFQPAKPPALLNVPQGTTVLDPETRKPVFTNPAAPSSQSAKPPTEQERTSAGLLTLIEDGNKRLEKFESDPQAIASLSSKIPVAGNFLTTEAARRYNNDMLQVVQSAIYALSGKAVTENERKALLQQYGYVPGDDANSLADKARRRKVLIQAVTQMAGRAAGGASGGTSPRPLTEAERQRAQNDTGFAAFLESKGYSETDWQ